MPLDMTGGAGLLVLPFVAASGACIGSFLGAVLVRLPQGRSVVHGASACDGCGRKLTAAELVPVLSWLALRGRCRTCGATIGLWQPISELGGAVVAVGSCLAAPGAVEALAAALFGWQLLLLALLDARHFWLPRPLTVALALTGAGHAAAQALLLGDAKPLVVAGLSGLAGYGLLAGLALGYRALRGREGMGGGDPPLMGAIGVWLGPQGVILTILGGTLIGLFAVLALFVAGRKLSADSVLPLGTCLAIAAWPLFVWGGGV